MNEQEEMIWTIAYAAAIVARENAPGCMADNAVLRYRVSSQFLNNETLKSPTQQVDENPDAPY